MQNYYMSFIVPVSQKPNAAKILESICKYFDVSPEEIKGKSRKRFYCDIRKVYAKTCLQKKIIQQKAANQINRNHSTIIYEASKVDEIREVKNMFDNFINNY